MRIFGRVSGTLWLGENMMGSADLPWPKINDYLLEVSSVRTKEDMVSTACKAISRLIPYDHNCCATKVDSTADFVVGLDESTMRSFNEYYRTTLPYWRDGLLLMPEVLAWTQVEWGYFRNSEFVCDFARPLGLGRTLTSIVPGRQFFLNISRSTSSRRFSDAEKSILDVVMHHCDNLHAVYEKLNALSSRSTPTAEMIRDRFSALSPRQAVVLSLLLRGLSTREIGSHLSIGKRTVESHTAHIYDKLNVRSRPELRRLLDDGFGRDRTLPDLLQ
jgi:DNA-binding CsgD family transcriptional regulator